jgi:Mrp family chromosome partitioning ATPase/capsular polysaccharide biosynthesis protein
MEQTTPLPGIGIKPLLSLKRHYKVSVVVFFMIVVFGFPVVWNKGISIYSAEAIFQVAPRYMKNLETDAEVELQSNSQYREFVNHLQNTVTRYDVLERALAILNKQGIDTRPAALTQREYIEKLQRILVTQAIADTYMVKVRLNGGPNNKAHLHAIVNAIMASFLETAKAEQIYGSSERYNVLQEEAKKLREEITAMELKRAGFAERLGLTTFSDAAENPYDRLLAGLREKLTNAEIERRRAEGIYQAFVTNRELPTNLGNSLLQMRQGDMTLINLRAETTKRITELSQKLDGLAEKHPARPPAEAEITYLRDSLKKAETEFDTSNFSHFKARMSASLQESRALEDGIRMNVNQMESQATEFAQIFQAAMQFTHQIRERNERIKQIQKRLDYLETESNALGFVRLVTPALPAEQPTGAGKTKLLLGLILGAFGAALALPVVIDMLDRRIRSVNEAENLLGIPAAGWQIRREDLPTRLYAEEQSRRFTATLMRLRARSQRSNFAFTSVKSRGGTTTTVLDTARTLTTLGARVLVIEANTFTPFPAFDTHRPGLSELLIEGLDAGSVIRRFEYEGSLFDVVGVGGKTAGGLQRLDRLRQALDHWQSDYEYVLFDLPPILLSADAEMLIEVLGQVFLVVQAEAVEKGEISRAKRLLQKIDPEAVGLFVNEIPLFRGSGYMEETIVETLTGAPFKRFVGGASLSLQWELLRTQWALNRGELLGRFMPWKRRRREKPSKPDTA